MKEHDPIRAIKFAKQILEATKICGPTVGEATVVLLAHAAVLMKSTENFHDFSLLLNEVWDDAEKLICAAHYYQEETN